MPNRLNHLLFILPVLLGLAIAIVGAAQIVWPPPPPEPPWRFTPSADFGKPALPWKTDYHWASTTHSAATVKTRCAYRLIATASRNGAVLATHITR